MAVENSVFFNIDSIKIFVQKNYDIKPINVEKVNYGSANCYKIVSENENFFLKEFQNKFDRNSIKKEIFVCQKIEQYGIPTSQFVETKNGDYIIEESGHQLHLQKFIDGCTLERNCFTKSLLLDSAKILGKINLCLGDVDFLSDGFPDSWFDEWKLSKSIAKHINIMNDVEISDMRDDLKQKVICACETKIDLLKNFNMDYLKFKNFEKVNSHGDYNNLQIICEKDLSKIKAIIDFSSASRIPAIWEIIRSYSYGAQECVSGNNIDLLNLKAYLDSYLKYNELPLFDVSNMAGFYYYNLLRSSFGLNSKDEKTIEFAVWRTNLCEYLSNRYLEIDMFLYEHYRGSLI